MSAALDALIFGYRKLFKNGVEAVKRDSLDLIGSDWSLTDNPTTKRTELTFTPAINVGEITSTIFVDAAYAGGNSTGTIAKPFTTIQDALDAVPVVATTASTPTQVLVAPGTYTENPEVIANQQVFVSPWLPNSTPTAENVGAATVVKLDGHFVFNVSSGSAGSSVFRVSGFEFAGMTINCVTPASTPFLLITDCAVTDSISSSALVGVAVFSNTTFSDNVLLSAVSALVIDGCSFQGDLEAGPVLMTHTNVFGTFTGKTLIVARGSTLYDATFAAGTATILDNHTLATSAINGGLPTPTTPGSGDAWKGAGTHYNPAHTVRAVDDAAVTANLGDETIVVFPDAGESRTVTLPDAAMFAALADETNGAVARRVARHLRIKNGADDNTSGIVLVDPSGTDELERNDEPIFLRGGQSVDLVPVLFDSQWSWEHVGAISYNHVIAVDASQSNTTSGTFQDKLSLTTDPWRGLYKVEWTAIVSVDNADTIVSSRLYNDTDAAELAIPVLSGETTGLNFISSGKAFVAFSGTAKTLKLQYKRQSGSGAVYIQDVAVEITRVG